jgi:ATP-dependent Clp protease ATP-binding subunit ClpB
LLKVLLDDSEGLCAGLIQRAGGDAKTALREVETALARLPKVSGAGAAQPQATRELIKLFDTAEKIAQKAGDSFVTVERLLLALAMEKETICGKILARPASPPQASTAPSRRCARAAPPIMRRPKNAYDALKKYARDLTKRRATASSIR